MILTMDDVRSQAAAPAKEVIQSQRQQQLEAVRQLRQRLLRTSQPVLFAVPVQPEPTFLASA